MNNRTFYSTNIGYHLLLGLLLGIWVYFFLVLIGPFDAAPVKLKNRATMMFVYALFFTLSYFAIIPLQEKWHKKRNNWTLPTELIIVVMVFLICFLPSYFYYKSAWVVGEYSFMDFTLQIFLPFSLIFMPIILAGRWSIFKYINSKKKEKEQAAKLVTKITEKQHKITKEEQKITLTGENSLDVLQVFFSDLICVKSANNYVEVYYQTKEQLHKKLLRTSTKKVLNEIPTLTQVHRSYLINTMHFIAWKNKKSISLTHLNVPVSDKYRAALQQLLKIHP